MPLKLYSWPLRREFCDAAVTDVTLLGSITYVSIIVLSHFQNTSSNFLDSQNDIV